MKLILAAELGKALLQRLSEAGEVLQEQGVPAGRTEVDLTGWATARLVSGEDGQPFKVLVCNTHPEHALDTTVHDGDVVDEHDILRPGYPRSLGSSKVLVDNRPASMGQKVTPGQKVVCNGRMVRVDKSRKPRPVGTAG